MLIKSFTNNQDDDVVRESKTIKIHNINSRIDTSKEFVGDNEFGRNRVMYSKQSSYCNMVSNDHVAIKDSLSVTIDKENGELVKYGTFVSWPFGINPSTFQFGFIEDIPFDVKSLNEFSDYKIINGSLVEDNTSLCNITNCFEDIFQLNYLPVAGMFLSFFSTILLDYPYVAQFVFDSEAGFNIVKIRTLECYADIVKAKLMWYRPLIASLFLDFKEECDIEKRHVVAYVTTHEYGVIVKIVDKNFNNMNMTYHINLSDNCRILQANEVHNSKSYGKSNLLNVLLKLGVPTVLDALGSMSKEGEND